MSLDAFRGEPSQSKEQEERERRNSIPVINMDREDDSSGRARLVHNGIGEITRRERIDTPQINNSKEAGLNHDRPSAPMSKERTFSGDDRCYRGASTLD